MPHFVSGATSTDLATRLEGNTTGIYYPLYSLSELPQVLAAKQAFPNVPFNVNINPASGPGTSPSTAWASAITQLKNAGAVVTGYVPTGYGTGRTIANVEGMISSYNQFYPNMLDGIMFDEVSSSCSEFTFYQTVSNYARSLGYSYIRANPGSSICQTDVPLFNHIAIYESAGYPSESTLASNTFYPQYSKNVVGFGATIHTEPTYDPTWLHMATKYLKWVYITDQTEPNPYAVFPSYFNQYLTDLSSLAGNTTLPTSTAPSSPTGLTSTTVSSSQVNLSWTVPSNNGGSTITGYEIERSTDGGITWSTTVANTGSTTTTYSDTGLTASITYTYRVSAINSVGTSTPSNTASATTQSVTTTPPPTTGSTSTGVMIPLYSYPGSYWTQVIQAKNAHPSVPIVVIINPNNGPGSSIDSNYVTGIQQLQAAGVKVLGYVYTSYGARSTSSIEADINSYNNWYHVSGINFDEMANTSGLETYYSNLSSYAKSLGMTMTVGNPGTDTLSSYIGTVDILDIYENPGLPLLSDLTGWHTSYPKSDFAFIGFGVSSLPSQSTITTDSGYVGYLYITDDTLPNPYDTVPSYLSTEVGMLDTGSTTTAPGSPTGLTATASSSSQINLSWTAPSNNGGSAITGYQIERSSDGGTTWLTLVANTTSTTTSYSDTGLAASTTYTYRVSAINSVGISSPSSAASATTSSGSTSTVPFAPTGLTATAGNSQASLSWSASSSNGGSAITGYNIYRGTTSGGESATPIGTVNGSTLSYTDAGLTNGQTYFYKVTAVNSVGESTPSNEASATPTAPATAPQSPTGLTATAVSSLQINLSWTAPSNNGGSAIAGYKIERSTDNGTTWSTVQSNTGSTGITYSDTGLTASTTYTYRVSAINSVGISSPSNTASVTTPGNTSAGTSTLTVTTQDNASNAITGLYIALSQGGTTVTTDYSPVTFTLNNNVQYSVQAYGYHTHVFDHWKDNGSTTNPRPITINANTSLTAVYRTPVISLNPSTGPAGTAITVTGTSFSSDSTVTISFDNTAVTTNPTTITTDSSGAFTTTFTVPQSTTGTHTVTATDASSHPALTQFTVSATSSSIVLNGIKKTSGTVSSSPYKITLSNFNAGTGSNRLLVVGVSANNNAVSSVTFGGVHLTKKVSSFSNNYDGFWYLKNPSGTGNIVVTMTGSTSVVVGAYSFSGVDQTTPIPTSVTNHNTASSSPTISITTQNPNSWVLDLPSIYGGVTLGSPICTQQWDANIAGAITGASSSKIQASPGLTTCSWAASGGGDLWDDIAVEIKASG